MYQVTPTFRGNLTLGPASSPLNQSKYWKLGGTLELELCSVPCQKRSTTRLLVKNLCQTLVQDCYHWLHRKIGEQHVHDTCNLTHTSALMAAPPGGMGDRGEGRKEEYHSPILLILFAMVGSVCNGNEVLNTEDDFLSTALMHVLSIRGHNAKDKGTSLHVVLVTHLDSTLVKSTPLIPLHCPSSPYHTASTNDPKLG